MHDGQAGETVLLRRNDGFEFETDAAVPLGAWIRLLACGSMTADPELDAWLALHGGSDGFPPDVTALRRRRDRPAGPPVTAVMDELVSHESGVRLRTYRHDAWETRATCVYVHGGAFVFGDLDSHDRGA